MNKMFFLCFLASLCLFYSCNRQSDIDFEYGKDTVVTKVQDNEDLYPVEDDAVRLSGTRAEQMFSLLETVNPEDAMTLYDTRITEEQFAEIKAFADVLVIGLVTQKEKHEKIFDWITSNIKYMPGDNDPYPVFKNHYGICQGFANLLKVMLLSQDIPVVSINGMMYNMGHAWAYVYADGEWYMSDPTNGKISKAADISDYEGYEPSSAELALFEDDDFIFEYNDGNLNLSKVKKANAAFTVPYSAGGFVITSFNPETVLPDNIRDIYIGKNIETLGGQGVVGLQLYGKSVETVSVDPLNTFLESYKEIVYNRQGDTTIPYYIPYGKTSIELKPNKIYGKGVISGHECVEEIIFPDGVERIEDYAIERCPRLERVYIPEDAVITDNALYGMDQEIEIIRDRKGSGIPVVTVD